MRPNHRHKAQLIESSWQTNSLSITHCLLCHWRFFFFHLNTAHREYLWIGVVTEHPVCVQSRGNSAPVGVLLQWDPPREGDLPVHNYRVTWMPQQTHTTHRCTQSAHGHTHAVHNNMHLHARPTHSRSISCSWDTKGMHRGHFGNLRFCLWR